MKPPTEYTNIYQFAMVLEPPQLDSAWRKRKRSREITQCLHWMVLGAAGMLLVVVIAGWLA